MDNKLEINQEIGDGAIHGWFELSYCSYLVLPRIALQSMPFEWQERFVKLLEEIDARMTGCIPEGCSSYFVMPRNDETGRLVKDPYANYERGRARLPLKVTS